MKLILKVSSVNTVRDSVLGHPPVIIATLGSNFSYFGDLFKIHLDPLPFVTPLGLVGGVMVEPSFTGSISKPLPRTIKSCCLNPP